MVRANEPPAILLVDDEELVRRTMARALARYFPEVLTAANQTEAEQMLEHREVTHVICDWNLGEGHPKGTEIVPLWRERWPSITHAVIFSGTAPADIGEQLPGVDGVVDKADGLEPLLEALGRTGG